MSKIPKLLLGYDTFERHSTVSQMVGKETSQTILDMGGGEDHLSKFIHNKITVINLHHGDVIARGQFLPVAGRAFDVVVSLDVLEHIPPGDRQAVIHEMIRVASEKVIFCTPYGSPQHERLEQDILDKLSDQQKYDQMLSEHVKYGLLDDAQIHAFIPPHLQTNFIYSGDYRFNFVLFKLDHAFSERLKFPRILLSMILNLFGIIFVVPTSKTRHPSRYTNRVFVEIIK